MRIERGGRDKSDSNERTRKERAGRRTPERGVWQGGREGLSIPKEIGLACEARGALSHIHVLFIHLSWPCPGEESRTSLLPVLMSHVVVQRPAHQTRLLVLAVLGRAARARFLLVLEPSLASFITSHVPHEDSKRSTNECATEEDRRVEL